MTATNYYVPIVLENEGSHERSYDLHSRMLKDRIVFINGPIDSQTAHMVSMQLIYLESVDDSAPINLYINSEGGSVMAGLAIADTMNHVSCPIAVTAMGMAMSMGAYLLSSGTKGKRYALPSTRIMCHAVSSGMGRSTVHDMKVSMRETEFLDDFLAERLAANCGQSIEKYKADTQRDFYMSAEEALAYGLIDEVVTPRAKKVTE